MGEIVFSVFRVCSWGFFGLVRSGGRGESGRRGFWEFLIVVVGGFLDFWLGFSFEESVVLLGFELRRLFRFGII